MIKKLLILFCCFVVTLTAFADWDESMPFKWVQYPDLSIYGIDVNSSYGYKLADDFECTVTGPLTDFHIWCSWLDDWYGDDPYMVDFLIQIYKDIPADESPTEYSMPGELLWERQFAAYDFSVRVWADQIEEGWWDPGTDNYTFPADFTCWQYNFLVDPEQAFIQEGTEENPVIYWVAIQATPLNDGLWGWKTRNWPEHFNDDAVYWDEVDSIWKELIYPGGHEFFGESIDLAFVITGEEEGVKWEQLPNLELSGLHAHDYDIGYYEQIIIADDWLCEGGVVTDFHWWGYEEAVGAGPSGFHLSIHANDPTGMCLPLDPPLWQLNVPITAITITNTGKINSLGQPLLRYDYDLDPADYFYQEEGQTYWFDVSALSVDPLNAYRWLWAEHNRSPMPILCGAADYINPSRPFWQTIFWANDYYSDMAFRVTSEDIERELDFGDAMDAAGAVTYPTLLASDGARHIIVPGVFLGNLVDPEPDGQPTVNADGDDLDVLYPSLGDDEDGVVFTSQLVPGLPATVDVTASVGGVLYAWLDFNGDGSWAQAGDQIFNGQPLVAGLNSLTFNVPMTATAGTTYARFRFVTTSVAALSYTGLASDGEVEDHEVKIYFKWSQPPVLNPDASQYPDCFWGWDEVSIYQPQMFPICWFYPYQCYGDVNGDNAIDTIDLAAFMNAFNTGTYDPCCDFDRNGVIDIADLAILQANMGADLSQYPPCDIPDGAPQIVADDWICTDKRPITDIHWWGSYVDYMDDVPPGYAPDRFHIGIWTDVPAGVDQRWSHPGQMIWEWIVPRSDLNEHYVGCDFHPEYMLAPDSCFRYDFKIPESEWFFQEGGETIYWISIAAIYPGEPPTIFPWGWKTRPHFFNDDAVRIFMPTDPVPGAVFEAGQPIEDEAGNSWDMAFVLTTTNDCRDMLTAAEQVDYDAYIAAGADPSCWCWQYQCRGDANNDKYFLGYRVYTTDLNRLAASWKALVATADPCADIAHDTYFLGYRVYTSDLNILAANWKKLDTQLTNCPGYDALNP